MTGTLTVRNDIPRRDTEGNIVDAHEPCVELFDGRFYLYGMGYDGHSGWTADNLINCYSSEDLATWTYEGALFPPGRIGIPCVKRNQRTGEYVLWQTKDKHFWTSVAAAPTGPFTAPERSHVDYGEERGLRGGDYSLFVDDDGTGYVIYTASCGDRNRPREMHQIVVERLTDDFRSGAGDSSGPLAWNCEAPAMFRRNGVYYALFDNTCCWCAVGTGCRVYTAEDPLGPFTYRGDINRVVDTDPRRIVSNNGDTEPGDGRSDAIIAMQTRRILELPTPGDRAFVIIGDRWQTAPDGLKGHDFTYWTSPLEFDADGMIRRLEWEDRWTIDVRS